MNIIIFDFEVFKYDTLLGALIYNENGYDVYQSWNLTDIIRFYQQHLNDIWVGHNNDGYDNHILNAILNGKNAYNESKSIINSMFRSNANLDIYAYDLMCCSFYSLKMTELCAGKKVHTTDVDFNLDRQLTDEEKSLTEKYNLDDLLQTKDNFLQLQNTMLLRLRLLSEFDIDKKYFTATEAKLAALALHAKQIPGIEYQYVKPKLYDSLILKNQDVIDFYLNEGFRKGQQLTINLCGVPHQLGSGGIHAAVKCCHETDVLYLDVSGYYNLVMINYNLLPRTIPQEGKALYEKMYHDQLKLKGVDDAKRWVYKVILLAVFGASMNKYTDFYDPQVGSLITIVGQVFAVDLLEHLEGKIKLIQSNTDGIMVKPLPTSSKEEVLDIVKEWCSRTGFVIKPKVIKEIYQRDVNNYVYVSDAAKNIDDLKNLSFAERKDYITTKGEAVGSYLSLIDSYTYYQLWKIKEPKIIAIGVVDYLLFHTMPEETVNKYKNDLRYYQYICKKNTFDYCTYDTLDISTNNTTSVRMSDMNRAFPKKFDGTISMIYKHKDVRGKHSKTKISNLPDNIFVYNDEILSKKANEKLLNIINFDYYIDRIYERIKEFVKIQKVEDILL